MSLHVHIAQAFSDAWVWDLRAQCEAGIEVTHGPEPPDPARYDILVSGRPTSELLTASPSLHTMIIPWAGLPEKTAILLQDFPHLAVHNLHHNAQPTAELAITLMLTAAKFVIPADRKLRQNDWTVRYEESRGILLAGKTAVILGYGAIGQTIARVCRGLGMHVVGVARTKPPEPPKGVLAVSGDRLHEFLPQANAFFVCLPWTPHTEGIIGEKELTLLPEAAVLVNVARGPVVQEEALYNALRDGRIRAGLDVWYHYPQEETDRAATAPSDYPFGTLDNVVMTPHMAGHTERTEALRIAALADTLNAAARGESLPHRVNLALGY